MLAVLAIIILAVAIMILFDVQRIMRGKIRTMSGIDAAALTGYHGEGLCCIILYDGHIPFQLCIWKDQSGHALGRIQRR